jgi:Spy/CpxP family protein refolding chaperone
MKNWKLTVCTMAALAIASAVTGCGGSSAPTPPTTTTSGVQTQASEANEDEHHRHQHHGGVGMLIGMSLKELDLSADQTAAIEKIRADVRAKAEQPRAAGQELAAVLADGVAAGAVDRAKTDAAIDKLAAAADAMHSAMLDALNQLHGALNAQQRAALVDKLQAHFDKWKEAHGRDEADDHAQHPGHLAALTKELGLTPDQAEKIRASFREGSKPRPQEHEQHLQDHDHKDARDFLAAFATAFKADTFDAKSVGGGNAANAHMARWGATRMARFFEAAAPVLTPDQRAKLAGMIRDRTNRRDP